MLQDFRTTPASQETRQDFLFAAREIKILSSPQPRPGPAARRLDRIFISQPNKNPVESQIKILSSLEPWLKECLLFLRFQNEVDPAGNSCPF